MSRYAMGLYAVPKYEGCDVSDVYRIENYLDALRLSGPTDESVVRYTAEMEEVYTPEMIEFYKGHYRVMYWPWDTEKKFPRYRIVEEVLYWDYAPQIANWFKNNVEPIDNWCCPTITDLQKLYTACHTVCMNLDTAPNVLPIPDDVCACDCDYSDGDYLDVVYATAMEVHRVIHNVDFNKYTIHFDCDWD